MAPGHNSADNPVKGSVLPFCLLLSYGIPGHLGQMQTYFRQHSTGKESGVNPTCSPEYHSPRQRYQLSCQVELGPV